MVRVLLADDHTAFRDLVRGILDDTVDIRVVAEANDGDAAVAGLRQHRPDIAILDLDMPGQDGLRVACLGDQLEPPVKSILLTVHKSPALLNKALVAGLCGYVLKDEAVTQIVDCVRRVHAGERYFSKQLESLQTRRWTRES
jgi:DNA-binding NarL/FixJ family response regulator